MYLGGAELQSGMTMTSIRPMSCSSMRCFKCDKKVQRYINAKWADWVDYMFVRNHNTNLEKLKTGL